MRRHVSRRLLAVLLLPAVTLAACSTTPSSDPSSLTPAAAPSGWTTHDLGPVRLGAPATWEAVDVPTGDAADEAYTLRDTGEGPGTGVHVTVTGSRSRDASAAVDNLVTVGDATLGAEDVVTDALTWPGAQDAGFVTYLATLRTDDGEVEMRYEYLVLDLEDEAQAVVAVIAPAAGFDDSGAHGVLASVTVA